MQLTQIQSMKVEELVEAFIPITPSKVDFKAPTGSGKTIMASFFISSLIERFPNESFVFVIATLSSSELPQVFEDKINLYKKDLPFYDFDVEYIKSPSASNEKTESTVKLLPLKNKVFIFGKASFGKGRIFTEQGTIDDFVQSIESIGSKLIYIRDEAHVGGKAPSGVEIKHFENLMRSNAHFVLNMTATPEVDSKPIILSEKDLNDPDKNGNQWLLKTTPTILLNKNMEYKNMLLDAVLQFKNIKNEYLKLENDGIVIRPAMLIQVDNESADVSKKKEFKDALETIKSTLSEQGMSWVQYFGSNDKDSNRVFGSNFDLADLTDPQSPVDCIIFKIGPATGWDIPRACMLLQLRDVSSSTLNTQTIGRIKRNPFPNLLKNPITDRYYIYSNSPKARDEVTYYHYDVSKEIAGDEFLAVKIKNKRDLIESLNNESLLQIKSFLINNKNHMIQTLKGSFIESSSTGDAIAWKRTRLSANGHEVYSAINNVFILLKDFEILKKQNNAFFNQMKTLLDEFYDDHLKDTELIDGVSMRKDFFYFIVLSHYLNDLKKIVRECSPFKAYYDIELEPYKPSQYVEIYSNDDIIEFDVDKDKYLFDVMKNGEKSDDNRYSQPLDSSPEKVFARKLNSLVNKYPQDVKIWGKNLTSSNVSAEYVGLDSNVNYSYFDFIVKFNNDTFLYFEVKSVKDINEAKTNKLIVSYKDYFSVPFSKRTTNNTNLIICLVKVDVDKNLYTYDYFYDISIFPMLNPSDNLDEVFKLISQ